MESKQQHEEKEQEKFRRNKCKFCPNRYYPDEYICENECPE